MHQFLVVSIILHGRCGIGVNRRHRVVLLYARRQHRTHQGDKCKYFQYFFHIFLRVTRIFVGNLLSADNVNATLESVETLALKIVDGG